MRDSLAALVGFLCLCATNVPTTCAQQVAYTTDTNVADFTAQVSKYATLSNFNESEGHLTSPFTPTSAELASTGYRVWLGGPIPGLPPNNNWILASFPDAVSTILVFPNIDHPGDAYDGYQYSLYGSNDGVTWTFLFDALTVNGSGSGFTLGNYVGTPPTSVNNVVTGGCNASGCVGYEAEFDFSNGYRFYAFGSSTEAINAGNSDQELSGVGAVMAVQEPVDGSALLEMCQQRIELCEGYIEGITDLLTNLCPRRKSGEHTDEPDSRAVSIDNHDGDDWKHVRCRDCEALALCLPTQLELPHLREIILAYLTNHPELSSGNAARIVVSALKGAYACGVE